jgi:hypothetical protein
MDQKKGFLNGYRPFIGNILNILHAFLVIVLLCSNTACRLGWILVKLTTGQQIIAATGRDGNNKIYPIACGVLVSHTAEVCYWWRRGKIWEIHNNTG